MTPDPIKLKPIAADVNISNLLKMKNAISNMLSVNYSPNTAEREHW